MEDRLRRVEPASDTLLVRLLFMGSDAGRHSTTQVFGELLRRRKSLRMAGRLPALMELSKSGTVFIIP